MTGQVSDGIGEQSFVSLTQFIIIYVVSPTFSPRAIFFLVHYCAPFPFSFLPSLYSCHSPSFPISPFVHPSSFESHTMHPLKTSRQSIRCQRFFFFSLSGRCEMGLWQEAWPSVNTLFLCLTCWLKSLSLSLSVSRNGIDNYTEKGDVGKKEKW